MAKTCKKGYYYCYTSKKCKKIPVGHHVMPSGRLMKDSEHEEKEGGEESTETKKNGNGNGGNGNGGAVSEGWSEKYKKSIDCKNPKGFSQRAHCQGRKKVNEAKNYEKGDHEISMAQTQLKKSEENIRKLRKALGTKEKNIPAWVQAKITDTEHNTDAASSYMEQACPICNEDPCQCLEGTVTEGKRDGKSAKDKDYSLRDWFKGGGWVQAGGKYDGKPCAKQPGQKTKPFCRDADDRASMTKDERERRAKKKRKEDPNPNRKGKAKMVSDSYSNWRQDILNLYEGDEYIDEGLLGKLGAKLVGKAVRVVGKVARRADDALMKRVAKPSAKPPRYGGYKPDGTPAIPLKGEIGYKPLKPRSQIQKDLDNDPWTRGAFTRDDIMRARQDRKMFDHNEMEGEMVSEKCWDGYEQKGMKKKGKKVVPNCVPVGEEVVSEEGKKDACYKKVKARYDVWPSAYASGALVKCREVGAANWGNKTKKESFSNWREDFIIEAGFQDMNPEDFKRYLNSLNSDQARDIAKKKYAQKNPAGSRSMNPSMDVGRSTPSSSSRIQYNTPQGSSAPRTRYSAPGETYTRRTTVNAAAETAAAKASKTAAQARRAARGGVGKRVLGAIGKGLRRNKYGLAATGAALGAAYVLGKVQNSFSRAPKNESVSIENSDGKTFAEVIDIIGPAQMQTATNQNGVWVGTTQLSNWREEFNLQEKKGKKKDPCEGKPKRWQDSDCDGKWYEKGEDVKEDWQKVNKKDKTDGMSQKAVNAYKRENPGSKLKTAVTEKNPTGKRAKRRKSFCARSNGQRKMHNIDCSKTPDKAICKARKRWRC